MSRTSEEVHVRRLKTFSNESRVSELHAWLADGMALNQQGGQEERVEEGPHDARLKSGKGKTQLYRLSIADF